LRGEAVALFGEILKRLKQSLFELNIDLASSVPNTISFSLIRRECKEMNVALQSIRKGMKRHFALRELALSFLKYFLREDLFLTRF